MKFAALVVTAVLTLSCDSTPPPDPLRVGRTSDPKPRTTISNALEPDLPASAGCQGGRIVITNTGPNVWLQVKIEVNGAWSHTADAIGAGDTLRFIPNGFTKSDGTRLNLDAVACKSIDIHATVNGQRRHWNGAYK